MLGGGGDLCSRERWVSRALRESADSALYALRGSTGLRSLRRSAAVRSSRAPNVLRHLTKDSRKTQKHNLREHALSEAIAVSAFADYRPPLSLWITLTAAVPL